MLVFVVVIGLVFVVLLMRLMIKWCLYGLVGNKVNIIGLLVCVSLKIKCIFLLFLGFE